MKPSEFLKSRFRHFLDETSGENTVEYYSFNNASKSILTGSVDESQAYPGSPISLTARIDMYPTRAFREYVGLDVSFDAILRLSVEQLEEEGITLKIGDAFILPNETVKRYVIRIVDNKQKQVEFIEKMVLVTRKPPGRG